MRLRRTCFVVPLLLGMLGVPSSSAVTPALDTKIPAHEVADVELPKRLADLTGVPSDKQLPLGDVPLKTLGGATAGPVDCTGQTHEALPEEGTITGELSPGEVSCFSVSVPSGAPNLFVRLSAPSDIDLDLYVRYGAPATETEWDCRPYHGWGPEECSFERPKAGEWYVMVHAADGGGAFSLSTGMALCPTLDLGVPNPGHVAATDDTACHAVTVPEDVGALVVTLDGPNDADLDLIVRHGEPWEPWGPYDCFSAGWSSDETCRIPEPDAGVWYVTVYAYWGGGDYTITVELADTACEVLEPGVEIQGSSGYDLVCFQVFVEDADLLRTHLRSYGVFYDDLLVSRSPSFDWIECWSGGFSGGDRFCTIPGPEDGWWYVGVFMYPDGEFTVSAEPREAIAISPGLTTGTLGGHKDGEMYRVDDVDGDAVIANMTGLLDYDLFARRGSAPAGWSGSDCVSATVSPTETCILPPGDGPLYLFVYAYNHLGTPFTLTVQSL